MKRPIGFEVICPPIYEAFNWNMKLIMKALEYLRQELPNHLHDLPTNTIFHLIVYGDFLGNSYPAIGVSCSDPDLLPSFFDLHEKVNTLIKEVITIDKIKSASKDLMVISWNELKEQGYNPQC